MSIERRQGCALKIPTHPTTSHFLRDFTPLPPTITIFKANCTFVQTGPQFGCFGKDTGKSCTSYDVGHCPARCSPDSFDIACVNKTCEQIFQEDTCTSSGCKWAADRSVCYSDPDPSVPCSNFNSGNCPGESCAGFCGLFLLARVRLLC